jgi:hypothetical protein
MPSSDPGHIGGPVVIPGCVQVQLVWAQPNGRQALNVLHAAVSGGFATSVSIANAVHTALTTGGAWTALAGWLSTAGSFAGVRLLDLRAANLAPVDSTNAAVPGTSGDDPLPPSAALVVTERTAHAGAGFRGRFFIPNWTDAATATGGVADAGAVSALQAWALTVPTAFAASSMGLAIAQPARAAYTGTSGTAHPARAATTQLVTEVIVRNALWDNQRRRGGRS